MLLNTKLHDHDDKNDENESVNYSMGYDTVNNENKEDKKYVKYNAKDRDDHKKCRPCQQG